MGRCTVGSYADPHITHPCMGSHLVQRTADTRQPTVKHMGIDHCRFDVAMPKKILNSSNLIPAFEQWMANALGSLGILD